MQPNAVITGVSTGIGHELARQLLNRGYRVFGSVRDRKVLDSLADHPDFVPLVFDVTDYSAIDRAADAVAQMVGETGVQFLVNNAGIAVAGPLLHLPMAQIEHQFNVNVMGMVKVIQAFAPLLGAVKDYPNEPGRIIQISSISGKRGMPFMGPYSGSKFAMEGLSRSLRTELALFGIRVVVVGPGAIETPIWKKSASSTPKGFAQTPYGQPLTVYHEKFIRKAVKKAMKTDYFARRLIQIMEHPNPRRRYAIYAAGFLNQVSAWIPDSWIDVYLRRALGLMRKR